MVLTINDKILIEWVNDKPKRRQPKYSLKELILIKDYMQWSFCVGRYSYLKHSVFRKVNS